MEKRIEQIQPKKNRGGPKGSSQLCGFSASNPDQQPPTTTTTTTTIEFQTNKQKLTEANSNSETPAAFTCAKQAQFSSVLGMEKSARLFSAPDPNSQSNEQTKCVCWCVEEREREKRE